MVGDDGSISNAPPDTGIPRPRPAALRGRRDAAPLIDGPSPRAHRPAGGSHSPRQVQWPIDPLGAGDPVCDGDPAQSIAMPTPKRIPAKTLGTWSGTVSSGKPPRQGCSYHRWVWGDPIIARQILRCAENLRTRSTTEESLEMATVHGGKQTGPTPEHEGVHSVITFELPPRGRFLNALGVAPTVRIRRERIFPPQGNPNCLRDPRRNAQDELSKQMLSTVSLFQLIIAGFVRAMADDRRESS